MSSSQNSPFDSHHAIFKWDLTFASLYEAGQVVPSADSQPLGASYEMLSAEPRFEPVTLRDLYAASETLHLVVLPPQPTTFSKLIIQYLHYFILFFG